jgi:hypothetical protein
VELRILSQLLEGGLVREAGGIVERQLLLREGRR